MKHHTFLEAEFCVIVQTILHYIDAPRYIGNVGVVKNAPSISRLFYSLFLLEFEYFMNENDLVQVIIIRFGHEHRIT